jgi:nucleoside phosphorylase
MRARTPADYLIVTPMHEEFVALCAYFPDAEVLDKIPDDPHTYKTCLCPTSRSDGGSYHIVLTTLSAKGQMNAAAEVGQILERWSPRNVLLVGIAAGNSANKVNSGDVLLAMDVIGEVAGKTTDSGTARDSVPVIISRKLYESASQLAATMWYQHVLVKAPVPTIPKCHNDGIIISVSEVLADSRSMPDLHKKYRHLLGIETEAAGAWTAMRLVDNPPSFFMIRAVSDAGDPAKTDEWHAYAASAAAAFCHALLSSGPTPVISAAGPAVADPPFELAKSQDTKTRCCSFPRIHVRPGSSLPFTQRAALQLERLRAVCLSKCRVRRMLLLPIFVFLSIFLIGMSRLWSDSMLTPLNTVTVGGCLLVSFVLWKYREAYRPVIEQAEAAGIAFSNALCGGPANDDDVRFFSEMIPYLEARPKVL